MVSNTTAAAPVERMPRAIPSSRIDTSDGMADWSLADAGVLDRYGRADPKLRNCGTAIMREQRPREDAMSAQNITVLNPMGFPPKVVTKPLAPRLSTLDGKTVYLVDCRFDDSDVFLKQMQAWFGEHMPGMRTVFKQISSVYLKDDPTTWEEIRARGHAAIVGVGH